MDWIEVESSNIDAVAYDSDSETLYIRFKGGAEYEYRDVPEFVYEGLLEAESKGKYFWRYIRNIYSYGRI